MTTLKVLKVPIMILLQTVPKNINLKQLSDELIKVCRDSYEAEVNIHNLHVWTLTGNKVVGTVHMKLINESNQIDQIEKFNKIVGPTRQIFHNFGIHYLTIQPEFSNALVRYGSVETTSEEFQTTTDSDKCLVVCCEEGTKS
jgi:zinc transporter 1